MLLLFLPKYYLFFIDVTLRNVLVSKLECFSEKNNINKEIKFAVVLYILFKHMKL